jgi:hypothetical protein
MNDNATQYINSNEKRILNNYSNEIMIDMILLIAITITMMTH